MDYKNMKKADLIAHILKLEARSSMQVTACQVYPFRDGPALGGVKALATIVLDDAMQIRGLRVMAGANGLYVDYPADPFYRGDAFKSICAPITKAMREAIDEAVLGKYKEATSEATGGKTAHL